MACPKRVHIYGAGFDACKFSVGRPAAPISNAVVGEIEVNASLNIVRLYGNQGSLIATFSGLPFFAVYPYGLEQCEVDPCGKTP